MRFLRFLLLAALIVGACYFSWYLFAEKADKGGGDAALEKEIPGSMSEQVQSFSIFGFSESGDKAWEVRGRSADIYSEVINLTDIDANSYGEEVKVNLTADEGVFNRTNNDIELMKNVVAVTDEGTTLKTERMIWEAEKSLINTGERVFIERKDMDIEGTGASAKPDLKKARLHKDITLKIKDPVAVITCDGPLDIDYNNNIAYFNDNVKVDDGKVQIYSDKSTTYFDPKQKQINKVFCEGNVKIVRGEDVTYSETLSYLPEETKVVLSGSPKIVIFSTEGIDIGGAIGAPDKEEDSRKAQSGGDQEPAAVITCDGTLEVDYEKNIAYFNDNVKMDDGKSQIYSDKSTAYFDPKRKKLSKVYFEGNVKIMRGEDVTYAKTLTYLPEEGRAILSGRPKIIVRSTGELTGKDESADNK
ncbi:MAG: LPS export ABC transporter periplasmic protein LptC [Candidatus Omnitrophica bacterium]|nr:LPS export ABC transporter periplasmic protein LptC [Candidatus Omnitrophota bacterium]